MKKFIISALIVLMMVFSANVTFAKDAELQVEFSFDPAFEVDLSGYKLYYTPVPGSGTMTFIQNVGDTATRIFDTPVFDLQPGKNIDFYLSAVYSDGTENFSPASEGFTILFSRL